MAFWTILAKIIKIVVTVIKYANLLSALRSGRFVESFIRSYLVGAIKDGLVESGIPLDRFDFLKQAEKWATRVLEDAGDELAHLGVVISPSNLLAELTSHRDRLLRGKAVGNGLSSVRNPTRVADPLVLHRGEFEREVMDLQVSGAGIDFEFRRIYRSGAAYLGPLGSNWDHNYNLRLLQENEYVVVLLTGELSEHRFVQHTRFGEEKFSYYVPPDGVHDVIVPDGDTSFLLKSPQGVTYRFESTDQPGEHRIQRTEDRFGNFLAFRYSPEDRLEQIFVNSLARHVIFIYDEVGHIKRIEDHAGRVVLYSYDDEGYLDCVAGPAFSGEIPSRLERYEYDQVGEVRKLARIYDWAGRIVVENEYERNELSDHFGKMIRQAENRGESTFFYQTISGEFDPTTPNRDLPTLRVWEYRRNGHQIEHVFNDLGNDLLTREIFVEGGRIREVVRRYRYNSDGQIIARLDPDGTLNQFLFGRDDLADSISWPDVDPVLGDVGMNERMSFGNLLATVTRGRRVAHSAATIDPSFWERNIPSVKMPDDTDDVVVKYDYDRESQLLTSQSDPRHTISADPLHVESARSGDPNFNPSDPRYIDHQRHLTRSEYGSEPRFELQRTVFPNRTRPSVLDGVDSVTGIMDEIRRYDANGRPLERIDERGYEWFNEYFDDSAGPKEGFLQRKLSPHVDLLLNRDTPDLLEIRKSGDWQIFDHFFLSGGISGDQITISLEAVRFTIYQSIDPTEIISDNPQVAVRIDGNPMPTWDQSTDAVYVASDLTRGIHEIELRDTLGIPVAVGRIHTHVSLEFEVDILGHVLKETDPCGSVTIYEVDVFGRKTKMISGPATNPSVVYYEYDPLGNLIVECNEWRNEQGNSQPEGSRVRQYRYDKAGLLLVETESSELGGVKRITQYRYDSEDNLREIINPRGYRTYFNYDALNRQIQIVRGACTRNQAIATTIYDLAGHTLAKKNPRGSLQLNGYIDNGGIRQSGIDTRGRVKYQTDPLGNLVVTDYDALDNITVIRKYQRRIDSMLEMLSRRSIEYDEHGGAVQVNEAIFDSPILTTDPINDPDAQFNEAISTNNVQNARKEFHVDAHGFTIAFRNPINGIHRHRFDGQGRDYDLVDAEGRRTFRIFDGKGNATRIYTYDPVHDPNSGRVTHHEVFLELHEYDELNREIFRLDSYGNRWEYQYDTLNKMVLSIDPLDNSVRFEYNVFGQGVAQIQERTQTGLGGGISLPPLITRREYDQGGNLTAIIDPATRRTEFQYDALDRLTESQFTISPYEPKEYRTYDSASNILSLTDRNGLVREYQYDLLNRLSRIEINSSSVASEDTLSSFSATFASFDYDAAGNVSVHRNDYSIVQINRDSRGLPINERIEIVNIPNPPDIQEIVRKYDPAGRRIKLIYPSGREILYNYDYLGRVKSIRNVVSPTDYPGRLENAMGFNLAEFKYVGQRLTQVEYGNGLTLDVWFDGRGREFERFVVRSSGVILWRSQRLRDGAGYSRVENMTTRSGTRARKFFLDSVYRLTHYLDAPVNWLNPASLAPPEYPVEPSESTGQDLTNIAIGPLELTSTSPVFDYDEMGNRLYTREPGLAPFSSEPNDLNQYAEVAGYLWVYDRNGNLRTDGSHSILYDFENRVQEISDISTGTNEVVYCRDALGRVVAEILPGSVSFWVFDATLPLVHFSGSGRKEFTPGHQPDFPIHAAVAGEDYWTTFDGLNSLRLLTDSSQSIVSVPLFRPFGASENNEISLSPLNLCFAGMWYTNGFNYYHSKSRTYRSDVGCYIQRDPSGFADSTNLYSYVRNSPLDYFDFSGKLSTGMNTIAERIARRHPLLGMDYAARLDPYTRSLSPLASYEDTRFAIPQVSEDVADFFSVEAMTNIIIEARILNKFDTWFGQEPFSILGFTTEAIKRQANIDALLEDFEEAQLVGSAGIGGWPGYSLPGDTLVNFSRNVTSWIGRSEWPDNPTASAFASAGKGLIATPFIPISMLMIRGWEEVKNTFYDFPRLHFFSEGARLTSDEARNLRREREELRNEIDRWNNEFSRRVGRRQEVEESITSQWRLIW